MHDVFDLEQFIQSMIETVVWCRHRLNETNNDKALWSLIDTNINLVHVSDEEIKQHCERIIAERSNRVHYIEIPKYEDLLPVIRQGRLMIFFYPCTMNMGTAQIVSDEYFDFSNYPPCDTWVYHVDENPDENRVEYLIAWVPPQFLERAQEGVETTPDESILWVTDLTDREIPREFSEALKTANVWI